MTIPGSAILRSQARFQRQALIRGRPLLFTFAGPWTRAAMNGYVLRSPLGTTNANGFASFATLPSDLKQELVEKWGRTFTPDGYVQFLDAGWTVPAESLTTITDTGSGEAWDVIYVLPTAFVENRPRMALVRRTPVYNKVVSVRAEDPTANTNLLIAQNLPCRLTPIDSGLDQDPELPSLLTATYTLECPYVYAGTDVLGAGIASQPAGTRLAFNPKPCIVTDNPSVYGSAGPVVSFRIASLPTDPGGEFHHQRYIVNLK